MIAHVVHPPWCDRSRCTAALSPDDAFRSGVGREHRSAPVVLDLSTALWLPARQGAVWLTEACAPWPCSPFLRVRVGDMELSMLAEDAARVLDSLSTLVAAAEAVAP